MVINVNAEDAPQAAAALHAAGITFEGRTDGLTPRELEVLKLLAHGLSNKDIMARLDVTEKTVKTHVHVCLTKLCLSSRTQAAIYALQHGLVALNEIVLPPREVSNATS